VGAQELGHTESPDAVVAEDLGHLLVGVEELLVLRVLELVLLDVSPQLLDALGTGSLLLADDVSELGGELHWLGESGSLGHVGGCCLVSLSFGVRIEGDKPKEKIRRIYGLDMTNQGKWQSILGCILGSKRA